MSIEFNQIPGDSLRLPGMFIEFSGAPSSNVSFQGAGLLIGQLFNTGSVAAGVITNITGNSASPDSLFGAGSMLAEMVKAAKAAAPWLQLYAIGLADNPAGIAAVKSVVWSGSAVLPGTLNCYIGGYLVQIAVLAGDTPATIVSHLSTAINAVAGPPVFAAINGTNTAQLDLTCLWKGETGNAIDVRFAYFDNDVVPQGLSYTLTQTTAGSGNPNVTAAIDSLGSQWFNWIAFPYTDAINLAALNTVLGARFGAMEAVGATAFGAYENSLAATSSFGATVNLTNMTIMSAGLSPTPPWIWSAVYMAVAGTGLSNDPSRQLRGAVLTGVLPPAKADRFDNIQRNSLLFDGIATHTVDAAGNVLIECEISTFQFNALGVGDTTWLYIETAETLSRIRSEQVQYFTINYPNWKLADDAYEVPAGQPIMQPKKVVIELLALYRRFMEYGWVQDYATYKAGLIAQVNASNANRCDVLDDPILIKNMRILAVHSEFQ
jgi:phage tail sheath gpL-like